MNKYPLTPMEAINKPYIPRILCAAIHYQDGRSHTHQPANINSGYVISGRRHVNCQVTKGIVDPCPRMQPTTNVEGFITDDNHFLNREEAAHLAHCNGQVKTKKKSLPLHSLYSRDLY